MQFIIDGVRLVKKTRKKHRQRHPSNHTEDMMSASGNVVAGNAGMSSSVAAAVGDVVTGTAPEDYQTDMYLDEYVSSKIKYLM